MEDFRALLILMVTIWLAGKIFRSVKLPVIFGELIGGIIVGPLVLNLVDPASHTIEILAELGIFFLMFHSGLEADPYELLKTSKKSLLIALMGMFVPFGASYGIAIAFGQTTIAAMYIALCVSITAVAVSARLFKDFKLQKSKAAHLTMSAAVINDIIAFVGFSIIITLFEQGAVDPWTITVLVAKIAAFFGITMWVGFKFSKYASRFFNDKGFTLALITALTLGLFAESIGLHMILGAFLAGLFIREEVVDEKVFNKIEDRFYGLSYSFLGPIFFASLAFHLDFSAVFTAPVFLGVILLVAIIGKVVGAGGAALLQKISPSDALIIGVAMNSRGAVELILASIGFEKGIIDQTTLSLLIVIGFVTTVVSIIGMKPVVAYINKKGEAA